MLNKLLQEIVVSIVGKSAEEIVELLNTPKYVNEFILAKKLDITINQTRNILYKISDYGLVSSVRKKDKKKGWYTYYWKFEILKCLEFLKSILLEKKGGIENEVKSRNSQVFYMCKCCGLEYEGDKALLMDFTCDECGEIFTVKDNSKLLRDLKRELSRIGEKLSLVEIEIENEQGKLAKKRSLEIKKEEKEKEKKKLEAKAKRDLKREQRKKEKEKELKILGKKKIIRKGVKKKSKKIVKKKKSVKEKRGVKKKVKKNSSFGVKKEVSKKSGKKKVMKKINKKKKTLKKTFEKKILKKRFIKKKKITKKIRERAKFVKKKGKKISKKSVSKKRVKRKK